MATQQQGKGKKWIITLPPPDETQPICETCKKLHIIIEEIREQLEEEKKAMDETIIMVEKMEKNHQKEIEEIKLTLKFEKDKVVMLERSLEDERKARIEEIYKQDRQTKDFDYISKDYEMVNTLNKDMVLEFEALKSENTTLSIAMKALQENKQSLLNELKKYEDQVTELENQNTTLRKRLYDTESQRDKFQIQIDKLKEKVSAMSLEVMMGGTKGGGTGAGRRTGGAMNSFGGTTGKKKFHSNSLSPLQTPHTLRWPNEHNLSSFQSLSASSNPQNRSRISDLSTINVIRKFNTDPVTIAESQIRSPSLWPRR